MYFLFGNYIQGIMYVLVLLSLLVSPISKASTYYDQKGVSKSEIEEIIETTYAVNPEDLSLTVIKGKADHMDLVAWQKLTYLLPQDILKQKVREYKVFTDALEGALAYVSNTQKTLDKDKWVMGVDYEDANNTNIVPFVTTLIHEFSHIISLSDTQVVRDYTECTTYKILEGCNKKDSYLNKYYESFWKNFKHEKYQESLKDMTGSQQDIAMIKFYEENTDSFVTEYAATEPVEDFAESFTFFVLSDRVIEPKTIKDQKINFFYQFPKLVNVRSYIRSRTDIRK